MSLLPHQLLCCLYAVLVMCVCEVRNVMCRVEGSDDVDLSRHFSYYAFEGQSGIPRWKHEVWPLSICALICMHEQYVD